MTTLAGEQVAGVTALTVLAVFEDMYMEQGGTTYNPAAKGERGFMKLAAAELDDGVNSIAHHLHTPLEIEAAVDAAVVVAAVPGSGRGGGSGSGFKATVEMESTLDARVTTSKSDAD